MTICDMQLYPLTFYMYIFQSSVYYIEAEKNGCNFADNIFKIIFLYENNFILFKMSLNVVLDGPVSNNPTLVKIMAWCWTNDGLVYWCMYIYIYIYVYITGSWHIKEWPTVQCSKLLPVRQPQADNFGGGLGTFFKLYFNFMFMIWDSRQQDWQLFQLSFEHCNSCHEN